MSTLILAFQLSSDSVDPFLLNVHTIDREKVNPPLTTNPVPIGLQGGGGRFRFVKEIQSLNCEEMNSFFKPGSNSLEIDKQISPF